MCRHLHSLITMQHDLWKRSTEPTCTQALVACGAEVLQLAVVTQLLNMSLAAYMPEDGVW